MTTTSKLVSMIEGIPQAPLPASVQAVPPEASTDPNGPHPTRPKFFVLRKKIFDGSGTYVADSYNEDEYQIKSTIEACVTPPGDFQWCYIDKRADIKDPDRHYWTQQVGPVG